MRWPLPLHRATFVRRQNRFRAQVSLDGALLPVHVPNSGRLGELFVEGTLVRVALAPAGSERKTGGDLVLVEYGGILVSVDARLPNRLVAEALGAGGLEPFHPYDTVQPEARVGQSRLDFLLSTSIAGGGPGSPRCWLETKSVTLVEDGVALFPDAPTARGVRHLAELARLKEEGDRVAVAFVVQRGDAEAFAPHPTADPVFAAALRQAHGEGVEVYAWRCAVNAEGSTITDRIAVLL